MTATQPVGIGVGPPPGPGPGPSSAPLLAVWFDHTDSTELPTCLPTILHLPFLSSLVYHLLLPPVSLVPAFATLVCTHRLRQRYGNTRPGALGAGRRAGAWTACLEAPWSMLRPGGCKGGRPSPLLISGSRAEMPPRGHSLATTELRREPDSSAARATLELLSHMVMDLKGLGDPRWVDRGHSE